MESNFKQTQIFNVEITNLINIEDNTVAIIFEKNSEIHIDTQD